MQLQIHYVGFQDGNYLFHVIRSTDLKHTEPVALPPPDQFSVKGHPKKMFLPELRWYLEDYLNITYGAYVQMAEDISDTMQMWGKRVFDLLFTGHARDWYQEARRSNFKDFVIKISSDFPYVMSWPWEALYSSDDGYLALRCCMERQVNTIGDPIPFLAGNDDDSIHILFIIPRPYGEEDVRYCTLARSLTDYIREKELSVTIDILRPPTFDRLRKVLQDRPGYYHIIHFDGHGGYGESETAGREEKELYGSAANGKLIFETDRGEADPIDTVTLSQLLAEYQIPFMILNACQSGMIDGQAEDPFACVAAGLMKAGIRGVVAMSYSLYVSGARRFVPAFYERLFSDGNLSKAVSAGRTEMFRHHDRPSIAGYSALQDWIVPVVYQQIPGGEPILRKAEGRSGEKRKTVLPAEVSEIGDYGFIGRDSYIRKLERAMLQQKQAGILVYGQAGIGKTVLAKGFLNWLDQTGGIHGPVFWFDFQEIHSAEYLLNRIAESYGGIEATAAETEKKKEHVIEFLFRTPCVMVWDNFESASGIENTSVLPQLKEEDRLLLQDILRRLRGGRTKVLITSRMKEDWLSVSDCYRMTLEGLAGEELWEYCNAVVQDLGLQIDRKEKVYSEILERLCGNPLVIRAILLRLDQYDPDQLLAELENSFEGMQGDESTRRIQAAYDAVFSEEVKERFLPILQLISLHEQYVDKAELEKMLYISENVESIKNIDECFKILEHMGFGNRIKNTDIYFLHPALKGYLLHNIPITEKIEKAFIIQMTAFSLLSYFTQLEKWDTTKFDFVYQIHYTNLYYAEKLAGKYTEDLFIVQGRVMISMILVELLLRNNQYKEAIRRIDKMLNIKAADDDKYMNMIFLSQKTKAFSQMHDFISAEENLNDMLKLYENLDDEIEIADIYLKLGGIKGEQRKFDEAIEYFRKSLEIMNKYDNKQEIGIICYSLGVALTEQGLFSEAESYLLKAKERFQDQNDLLYLSYVYYQLGVLSIEKGEFHAARDWHEKSLIIKKELGDQKGIAAIFHQFGLISQFNSDFENAKKEYEKAVRIFEQQGNEYDAMITYYQLASVAELEEDFRTAKIWCDKVLKFYQSSKNLYGIAAIKHELEWIDLKQGNFESAHKLFEESISLLEEIKYKPGIAITSNVIGLNFAKQGKYDNAVDHFRKSWKIYGDLKDEKRQNEVYSNYVEMIKNMSYPDLHELYDKVVEDIVKAETAQRDNKGK